MNESKWWLYIREVAGDAQLKEIADRVGIDKSNVTRWKNGARPAADFAVSFARAYGRPVVEALVAGSYITEAEAELRTVPVGVGDLKEVDLARELLARLEHRNSSAGADQSDELAQRRDERATDCDPVDDDGSDEHFYDAAPELRAVAHTPTHPPVHDPDAAPDYDGPDSLPGDDDIA